MAPVIMILKAILSNKRMVDQDDGATDDGGPAEPEGQVGGLAGSPHYAHYKTLFDYLDVSGQPQYKIDWLLRSLDMGHKISEQFVRKSIEMGLPYFCETESELMMVADPERPAYRGSVRGMLDAAFLYNMPGGIHAHKEKCGYWVKRLMTLAQEENREAQAALCCKLTEDVLKHEIVESFRTAYTSELWKLAEASDGAAQLAVGEFLCAYGSAERLDWLSKAAKQGLSDAWCYLGKEYEAAIRIDRNRQPRKIPLSDEQVRQLREKAAECYLHGAEADNGVMAGWCQCEAGEFYEKGNLVAFKNADLALYWYEKALKNGDDRAKERIEAITNSLQEVTCIPPPKHLTTSIVNSQVSDLTQSEELQQCRRFWAFVTAFCQRDPKRHGHIRVSLDNEDGCFEMRAFILGDTLEKYIKEPMDQEQCELLYQEFDSALLDASKFEYCLETINSFHELNIYYTTSVDSKDMQACRVDFEKTVSIPGSIDVYFSAIKRIVNPKYPDKFYEGEDVFGMLL